MDAGVDWEGEWGRKKDFSKEMDPSCNSEYSRKRQMVANRAKSRFLMMLDLGVVAFCSLCFFSGLKTGFDRKKFSCCGDQTTTLQQ